MKNLNCTTSISDETSFSISITEEFGWIEPVFLLISPNLCEILRLGKKPISLLQIKHFEITNFQGTYALKFIDLENALIKGNTSDLIIKKAKHVGRHQSENGKMYSSFECSYQFTEMSEYQEYCFFYKAKEVSYLTTFNAFEVEDYE